MKALAIVLLSFWLAAPALAQHEDHHGAEAAAEPTTDPHAGHNMSPESGEEDPEEHETRHPATESRAGTAPPPAAFSGPAHAADTLFDPGEMADARERLRLEQGAAHNYLILGDRLEARFGDGHEQYLWDVQGWYGGDIDKLWLKSEGEFGDGLDEAEFQVLYSRAVAPFFDVQAGIRQDFGPEQDRTHIVLGLQGLVPYGFELDAAAFLSNKGDLTARVEAEYDLQITQRMLLQPRVELNLAAQEIPELAVGSGLGSVETGIRLRYEIRREFAPYLGMGWRHQFGGTSDFTRAAGEDTGTWWFVAGVRSWF